MSWFPGFLLLLVNEWLMPFPVSRVSLQRMFLRSGHLFAYLARSLTALVGLEQRTQTTERGELHSGCSVHSLSQVCTAPERGQDRAWCPGYHRVWGWFWHIHSSELDFRPLELHFLDPLLLLEHLHYNRDQFSNTIQDNSQLWQTYPPLLLLKDMLPGTFQ